MFNLIQRGRYEANNTLWLVVIIRYFVIDWVCNNVSKIEIDKTAPRAKGVPRIVWPQQHAIRADRTLIETG